jgi:hypothetical protein
MTLDNYINILKVLASIKEEVFKKKWCRSLRLKLESGDVRQKKLIA